MEFTSIKHVMTECPAVIGPDQTLQEAACEMRDLGCGALPVGRGDALKGIITDRDIVVRAVARGKDVSKERVSDYMTPVIHTCRETDSLADVTESMRQKNIGRLVVLDAAGRVSGIISFGAILRKNANPVEIGDVLARAGKQEMHRLQ